mmetsp:Transcript_18810/g.38783  ORF Transcript_18810/g.38783 Transcript_18810/m.38783 type:complete len:80 (+) Transcript_18810:1282-1521(+)
MATTRMTTRMTKNNLRSNRPSSGRDVWYIPISIHKFTSFIENYLEIFFTYRCYLLLGQYLATNTIYYRMNRMVRKDFLV